MTSVVTKEALIEALKTHGHIEHSDRIVHAYKVAEKLYKEQQHWSRVSLLDHVLNVLTVLLPFKPDEDGMIACLLHHYLDSEASSLTELEEEFGPRVRNIVSGIHLLSHVSTEKRKSSIEDLRLMMLTVSEEIQTILITLCDRCQLLEMRRSLNKSDTKRIATDVLDLFAPVAARLGMYGMKHRLESQAFPILYANDAERIFEQLASTTEDHGLFLDDAAKIVVEELAQHSIEAEVLTRQKQPYSIFRKLHEKSVTHIEDIYDLYALRVLVDSIDQCYQALGILHNIAQPVANRFKDYIAFAKPNGYQSLHTTVIKMPGAPPETFVEVQIRTKAMHKEAEFGIAAHWMYKQSSVTEKVVRSVELTQALSAQHSIQQGEDRPAFADQIFVLTPKGDVIELPEGSTPLDFAFTVHTQLGLSVRSVRVNQSIAPLNYELQNGDVVEVLRHKTPQPSAQWLNILKMSSARSKLKRYLYSQNRDQYVTEGKRVLNAELEKKNLPPLTTDLSILRSVQGSTLTMSEREEILMKLGQDAEKPAPLIQKLDALKQVLKPHEKKLKDQKPAEDNAHIMLEGNIPLPMCHAKCCKPTEGETSPIVGLINRQGKVMIHRKKCRMIKHANKERMIKASWKVGN